MLNIIPLLILSYVAFATNLEIPTALLENPEQISPRIACTPAEYCQDLARAVCSESRRPGHLLESAIRRNPLPDAVPTPNGKPFVPLEVTLSLIRQVENETFTTLPVSRDNLNTLFSETRSALISVINRQENIPASVRQEMSQSLNEATFMMGNQYLEERIQSLTRNNPDAPHDEIVASAINEYQEYCGGNGLNINAFRRGRRLVFCPGLLFAVADLGANDWTKMANSLAFTMAHELGHNLSDTTFPETYQEMGNCFNQISGRRNFWSGRGEEIGGDFWGTEIMAERMRAQGIVNQDALNLIVQSTVDFCNLREDEHYPSGRDRINLIISRHPTIRESLGCAPPSSSAPACNFSGSFSGN